MSICVWVCRPLGISSEHHIAGLPCFNHCEFPTNWQVGHHPQVSKQLLFWWFQPLWEIWNSESQLGWLFPTEKKCSKPPSNYYKFPALIHELLSLTSWFYSWFNHGQVWQETLQKKRPPIVRIRFSPCHSLHPQGRASRFGHFHAVFKTWGLEKSAKSVVAAMEVSINGGPQGRCSWMVYFHGKIPNK